MTESMLAPVMPPQHALQRRILELSQQALEGERPLSDLLGDALRELRSTVDRVQRLEAELNGRERIILALQSEQAPSSAPPAPPAGADASYHETRPAYAGGDPPLDLLWEPLPPDPDELLSCLRSRIAGALYLGAVRAGDRLPSIRELERRTGLNHKVIRRIYRALERSALAEVRDRSGIYVANVEHSAAGETRGVEGWLAEVVGDAVQRGVCASALPSMFSRATTTRPIRCACVDSTLDDRFALCHEIQKRFGIEAIPVEPAPGVLGAALAAVDLVVTTPFHADLVRRALAPGQPLVVARLHPAVAQAVRAGIGDTPVRIVCQDAAAGDRIRHALGPDIADRVEVLTVDRFGSAGGAGAYEPGIVTLAAWAALGGGEPPPHLCVPPYLSPQVSRRIAQLLVRLNRQGGGE